MYTWISPPPLRFHWSVVFSTSPLGCCTPLGDLPTSTLSESSDRPLSVVSLETPSSVRPYRKPVEPWVIWQLVLLVFAVQPDWSRCTVTVGFSIAVAVAAPEVTASAAIVAVASSAASGLRNFIVSP